MNHNILALGIGFAELIILLVIGGGVLIAVVVCVVAKITPSKKIPTASPSA